MNKKGRIALVITVFAGLLMCFMLFSSSRSHPDNYNGVLGAFLVAFTLACYWGYRFIQNDISFLKAKDD